MKELCRTGNGIVFYLQQSGRLAIYENGIYYYQTKYDKTIEDIENHNLHKLQMTETERERINYLMIYHNRNELIEEIFNFYNYYDLEQITIKKDDFWDYELEVLLENDFENYYCYSDETNYKYLIIEKKVGAKK